MHVGEADCQCLERALSLEWLEPNGRGGFASGTVAGPNTRRYHALLLIARRPPTDRIVLVNHVEETLMVGEQGLPLSTNLYPGVVHPEGYRRCVAYAPEPWPTWRYQIEGVTLRREIFVPQGRDLVVVRWRIEGDVNASVRLLVRPMLSGRDYHGLHHENGVLHTGATHSPGLVGWQPYNDLPVVRAIHSGEYRHAPDWYRRLHYPVEQERGLDCQEDWWTPGEFSLEVQPSQWSHVVFTTEDLTELDVEQCAAGEQHRRAQVGALGLSTDPLAARLWGAAEAFISDRGTQQTLIAGYPWFTDWGRDTFIALPGLCLVRQQFDVAKQILEAFAGQISEGMVPNRFPDQGEVPEYNTIDASLWFVHALGRYYDYTQDRDTMLTMGWPAVQAVLDGYRRGTRYGIRVATDGLVEGGAPGVQLTWMDAKVGDWVVTPRQGKPVEIQALWVRALAVGETCATMAGARAEARQCRADRQRAVQAFQSRFWHEAGGYLYDVVDGPEGDDASLRPNQIFALAFPHRLLDATRARRVVDVVHTHLVTPLGLRTLSAQDPRYRSQYVGDVTSRDGAYHQGTVWPFLLGPFITAWMKTHGGAPAVRRKARQMLEGLEHHLDEACIGHVSEIFDAEAPHAPRGCVAQAWSVAEPLRVLMEDIIGRKPER